jgi:hypothetical protein
VFNLTALFHSRSADRISTQEVRNLVTAPVVSGNVRPNKLVGTWGEPEDISPHALRHGGCLLDDERRRRDQTLRRSKPFATPLYSNHGANLRSHYQSLTEFQTSKAALIYDRRLPMSSVNSCHNIIHSPSAHLSLIDLSVPNDGQSVMQDTGRISCRVSQIG